MAKQKVVVIEGGKVINGPALREELEEALGGLFEEMIVRADGGIEVVLEGKANKGDLATAREVVLNHDPDTLTAEQEEEANLRSEEERLRAKWADVVDPANVTLDELAERVRLLELLVRGDVRKAGKAQGGGLGGMLR